MEKISYFYAIHCIQLFTVILGPFDIKIFFGGLKDTKRHHDMKKILLYASTKMKKTFFCLLQNMTVEENLSKFVSEFRSILA